jgi:acyl CoA:acetate/3-ketoacid CoA transferase alpha subunit
VAKTLTFQQWQSEWIGQIPNGQNQNRFPWDDESFVDDLFSNGKTVTIGGWNDRSTPKPPGLAVLSADLRNLNGVWTGRSELSLSRLLGRTVKTVPETRISRNAPERFRRRLAERMRFA